MNLDEFKQIKDVVVTPVEIQGGIIHVRVMDNEHGDEFEQIAVAARKAQDFSGMKHAILARTLCDESGELLLADITAEEVSAVLGARSRDTISAAVQAAFAVNGLISDEDDEDDALKNSEDAPSN